MAGYIIVIAILICIVVFCIYMFINTSKAKKNYKKELENKLNNNNANATMTQRHVTGLSLPEGAMCDLFLTKDKIIIEGNGVKFNLPKEKIIDVCVKTDVEIQKQYVSSTGGAVAGAMLFGTLGAIVGGRTKEKKDTTITNYLIYTYEKENGVDYISFELLPTIGKKIYLQFINDFRNNKKFENKEINL